MTVTMYELEAELGAILNALKVEYRKEALIKDISVQFVMHIFGVIVCGINRADYKLVDTTITDQYKGWRVVYVTTNDNISEKRDEIVWTLMRGGYLMWVRHNHTDSQFKRLMFDGNFANKVINKRLEIWGDDPKYSYLVECDKFAIGQGRISEYLAKEPGYFDNMPE